MHNNWYHNILYSAITSYTHRSTTDTYEDYASEVGEEAVNNSAWNSSKPVMFYVHGLNEGFNSESAITIAAGTLYFDSYVDVNNQ